MSENKFLINNIALPLKYSRNAYLLLSYDCRRDWRMTIKIMITGAAGFLGQCLARALLTSSNAPAFDELMLVDVVAPPRPNNDRRVRYEVADLTIPGTQAYHLLPEPKPDKKI